MRITYPTAMVLCALGNGHRYGFEISDATGLRAGTVYPILRRLEEERLVVSSWERTERAWSAGRPPRRNYRLTRAGERTVQEALDRYPGIVRLFDGAGRTDEAPA